MNVTFGQRVCLVLLILIWALESFIWQQLASNPAYHADYAMLACRLALDFCLAGLIVLALPKWCAALLMAVSALLSLTVYSYWNYFHAELLLTPLITQWKEGAAMGGDLFSSVPLQAALAAGGLFALKCALLWGAPGRPRAWLAWLRGTLAIICAAGVLVAGNLRIVNMAEELKGFSSAKNIATYGYLISWAAELALTDEADFFDPHPISRALTDAVPRLEPAENIIILQVESLDYGALNWTDEQGRPLTPFLNKLVAASTYHRITSRSRLGSASADCSVLMQEAVNRKIIPYKLSTYPFEREGSLPRLAGEAGYRTTALHGFDGNFFNRKPAYVRMGFDEVLFKEDLDARGGLGAGDRHKFFSTYGYLDRAILDFAADLAARPGKDLIFVITLTNHTPWEYLPESEQKYFPQPRNKFQNFANSINYVDRCLEEFYGRVPEGTLLLIYGDHAAVFEELHAGGDFVPYIILRKQGRLTARKNPPGLRDQNFTLEDISSHIGTLFKQETPSIPGQ